MSPAQDCKGQKNEASIKHSELNFTELSGKYALWTKSICKSGTDRQIQLQKNGNVVSILKIR